MAQKILYDEYGQSSSTGSGESFRFTGRRFDAETGLYYYRARYIDLDIAAIVGEAERKAVTEGPGHWAQSRFGAYQTEG